MVCNMRSSHSQNTNQALYSCLSLCWVGVSTTSPLLSSFGALWPTFNSKRQPFQVRDVLRHELRELFPDISPVHLEFAIASPALLDKLATLDALGAHDVSRLQNDSCAIWSLDDDPVLFGLVGLRHILDMRRVCDVAHDSFSADDPLHLLALRLRAPRLPVGSALAAHRSLLSAVACNCCMEP